MIQHVPLPDYKPDQTAHSLSLTVADNVLPLIDGVRAVGSFTEVSDSLVGTFYGAGSFLRSDGVAFLIAGTINALYRLTSTGAWETFASGLAASSRWQFAQFFDYIICVNGSVTQIVDLYAESAEELANSPLGNSVAVIGDYLMIGRSDGNASTVRWSAFADQTEWTVGVDQAGEQPLNYGGAIMGIASGEYGIILQRQRLVRVTRTGQALDPFFFDEISNNYGCAAPATIAQAGRTVFFYSDRGFMALEDGQVLKPIGTEKVDRTFELTAGRDNLENVYSGVDPANKLVFWGIPGAPGRVWVYNFELDKWATLSLPFSGLFPGYTASTGLEDLAAIYPNLDTMPYSLDDPRFQGGAPRMYLVDNSGKVGTLTGPNMAAQIDLGFLEFATAHRARVRKVRPISDAIGGVSLRLNAKARLGDAENVGQWNNITLSGVVPVRASGRYISPSVRIDAGTVWTYLQGLEFDFDAGGTR